MNYENTTKTFSERLRTLRTEAKLTQKQCAEQLGVETHNYNKWENEVSPPLGMICRIAKYFSVTTDYLLGMEDSRTHDGQAVFERLGLSDEAIDVLSGNIITDDSAFEHGDEDAMTEAVAKKFLPRMYSNFFNIIASRRPTTFLLHFFTLSDEVDKAAEKELNENDSISDKIAKALFLDMKRYDAEKAMGYNAYLCNKAFMKFLEEYMESAYKTKGDN